MCIRCNKLNTDIAIYPLIQAMYCLMAKNPPPCNLQQILNCNFPCQSKIQGGKTSFLSPPLFFLLPLIRRHFNQPTKS
ncbi:hypothetical protein NC653_022407 [Populus alba x Populus x berolinensis]|uniref:Uncharacterized protein n=1 Tax=Populus alba x Populus x berolinensis TaxID=444605 RepID=A0AAD6MF52_9ROSI|nr:hypothetical protein NC653_022407 [Populus alba x Populus x berolinensis]